MLNELKVMINLKRALRRKKKSIAALALMLLSAAAVSAQRDPFQKPGYLKERKPAPVSAARAGGAAKEPNYGPPAIEARIEYFKRLREQAAANGTPLPKVTSVLTLGEMAVTGIFKTPRGYAAMVEATPIKLSYTIYPGEKFFDGQLVAVEENRLVFRKVTKTGQGKFVASVENKPLRQFTMKSEIEGTAPSQGDKGPVQAVKTDPVQPATSDPAQAEPAPEKTTTAKASKKAKPEKPAGNPFLSPLDEMNSQPEKAAEPDKANKGSKKPIKVAKNGAQK